MRFLIINPYYPIDETPSPPLGLAFIAGALEAAGVEVRFLDFVVYPYHASVLETVVKEFSPDFVGVTSVTMSFYSAIGVIQDVKKINPSIFTVMGGPHVSFHVRETFSAYPELDFIVIGEGEKTIVELVETAEGDRNWGAVKGIAFRRGSETVVTGAGKPADVDSLPNPARHFIPLGRYRALGMPVSMTSSRGCPFQCIFCVGRKMVGAKVRYRNPVAVVDEMVQLNAMGFHQINLADDLFTANKQHCHAVCDEILRRGLNLSWTSFARVDTVSYEVLAKMKSAGCHTVSFGVETGNPEMLKRIKKGITLEQVLEAVEMCNQAQVVPHASFILGLPGETPETLKQTIDFGDKLASMGVLHGFHILAPFPGTEIRNHIRDYDLTILADDWSLYHANRAIVKTSTIDPETLDEVVIGWEEKYKQHLGKLKTLRENGEGTSEEIWPLTRLEHTVLIYDLMMAETIEHHGCLDPFPEDATTSEALCGLVENIGKTGTEYSPDELLSTLLFAVEQGYLTYSISGGRVQWEWVNHITALPDDRAIVPF